MSLFGLFKKKTNEKGKLSLEELLKRSASEPAYRKEFYERLLSDDLVIITQNSGIPKGSHVLQENTKVNIVSLPDGRLPVFTSVERIFDKGIVKEPVEYLQMKGANLFEMTKGTDLLLNPYSNFGKELVPEEIERMLNGSIFTEGAKQITVKKDTEVQLGQPAKYPDQIVQSLKILFATRPNVRAAYLGWIYNPESGDRPHYIFGIDADGDFPGLSQEAGFTAQQHLAKDELVDIIKIDGENGVSNYLRSTNPFYRR